MIKKLETAVTVFLWLVVAISFIHGRITIATYFFLSLLYCEVFSFRKEFREEVRLKNDKELNYLRTEIQNLMIRAAEAELKANLWDKTQELIEEVEKYRIYAEIGKDYEYLIQQEQIANLPTIEKLQKLANSHRGQSLNSDDEERGEKNVE